MGVMMMLFSAYQLRDSFTFKNSLILLKGTLQSCNTYVTTVESRRKYGSISRSQKAELIFYLNEYKKKFVLMENIGSEYKHEQYEKIKSKLERADSVIVWIKNSEAEVWEPQIFQLASEKEILLEFEAIRTKDISVKLFVLLLGLISIAFPLYFFYPEVLKRKK